MTTLIGWMNHLVGEMMFQGGYIATPRTVAALRDDVPSTAGAPMAARASRLDGPRAALFQRRAHAQQRRLEEI